MSNDNRVSVQASTLIMQFAKAAVPGDVKTRMYPALNPQQSLQLHEALCRWQLDSLQASGMNFCLALAGDLNSDWVQALQNDYPGVMLLQQQGRDLGERMGNAVGNALHDYQRCIVIGSDCPFIDVAYLQAAEAALRRSDCVIGPAYDGGYVLIGFRRFCDAIFHDIAWGCDSVLEATRANLSRLNYSYSCLDKRQDIDRPEDLSSLRALGLPLAAFADLSQ